MYIIGENIHIISPKVKEAIANRDGAFFVDLARKQMQNGATALDLNVGPQKKAGTEVVPWLVEVVQEAVGQDFTLSLDTTNLEAIKAGLKKIPRGRAIINSTSAEAERLEAVACDVGQLLDGELRDVHPQPRQHVVAPDTGIEGAGKIGDFGHGSLQPDTF